MSALAPEVRSRFAKRLRNLRVQRGYQRARYFAESLGIEENRYTRYERAEVEPNLTLIHKMCEMLGVTPNELLGFAGHEPKGASGPMPAFAEAPAEDIDSERAAGSSAWRLAFELTAVMRGRGSDKGAGDPLQNFRDTARLFQRLQSNPFVTIAEALQHDALKGLKPDRKAELAVLIRTFTDGLTLVGSGDARA
jgi:transcriptional regulator with XRE-family HTH domain